MRTLDLVLAIQGTGLELRPTMKDARLMEWSVCYTGANDMLYTGTYRQIDAYIAGYKAAIRRGQNVVTAENKAL